MANANGLFHALDRKAAISQAAPERHTTISRAAEALSRRNADAAIVELMGEAMQRLTLLGYERDNDDYCNIDPITWRLLIPAPFGRAGHKRWGITRAESDCLRDMLRERQAQTESRPPGLWLYDRARRCWTLNLFDYDLVGDGQAYWQRYPLGVAEYRRVRGLRVGR
jgi:hypothetical protein